MNGFEDTEIIPYVYLASSVHIGDCSFEISLYEWYRQYEVSASKMCWLSQGATVGQNACPWFATEALCLNRCEGLLVDNRTSLCRKCGRAEK